jgi:signal transduction histidine kinase
LRIDDRLETALRNFDGVTAQGATGQWHQLLDLLAQNPSNFDIEDVAGGLERLHSAAGQVPLQDRVSCVNSLQRGIRSAPLIMLLSHDEPPVAAVAMQRAQLEDHDWIEIIPRLGTRARGFLRLRTDLGQAAAHALQVFSAGDFLLPYAGQESLAVEIETAKPAQTSHWQSQQAPIGVIVERIEKWRRDRENADSPQLPFIEENEIEPYPEIDEIRFESDDNGVIIWAEGAPRGAIVGIDIARAAYDNGPGPDAYGAAAFRQRMPMESARMRLRGASTVEGDWRITAAPFFDSISGRFRGYRGIMRRPTIVETAQPIESEIQQTQQLQQMQQIVHELRTPLGAIAGFAEIIEQQLFGPVSADYRQMATAIIGDANQLLAGFDDLTLAAQMDRGQLEVSPGITECPWLASRLKDRLQAISENLGVEVNLVLADPVRPFAVDPDISERIFSRLLAAVIIGCENGEELKGRFHTELGTTAWNQFKLDLPRQLSGQSEDELLNSSPQATKSTLGSPLLGLGFSLRLVRNLAHSVGGNLQIQKESLLLSLPASQDGHSHYQGKWGE